MTPEQIIALILAAAPEVLTFIQAIITALNPPPTPAMGEDKAMPAMTPGQKALLTSLLTAHRDMHAMLCDTMSKNYGITV